MAYDPYLQKTGPEVERVNLERLVTSCKVVVVAAVPSEDTKGLLSADLIAKMPQGTLVVVISRAWCVDFGVLMEQVRKGRIQVAVDVFPDEPLSADDPIRRSGDVILSPHRAAAVLEGRHLIGDMILHDVQAMLEGRGDRQLKRADLATMQGLISAQAQLNAMPNT